MSDSHEEEMPQIAALTSDAVFKSLGTSAAGLASDQVSELQARYGKNLIQAGKKKSPVIAFLSNFTHLMAILLWVAGIIAFVAGMPELGVAVWLVNLINGCFSFWQEHQADKATEALKKMLPSYVNVMRDGQQAQVLAEDLVPGDVMVLAEGDKISADGRVVRASDLQVDQSTLTGESNPVRKTADAVLEADLTAAETPNLVFAGTSVSEGNGRVVVTKIGMATEFGKIASLTQNMEDSESPLQRQLDRLTKQVTLFALCMGIVFFLLDVLFVRNGLASSFIFALGMVVAFIPEGLLPTVTLSLAMAVQRMSKRNALVKKLSSVEALGSTSVICTDKTGTLTQNEMTVNHLWTCDREYEVTGVGYAPKGEILCDKDKWEAADNEELRLLVSGGALCSNARLVEPDEEGGRYTVLGDPTEACLLVSAQKAGLSLEGLEREMPRVRELPFESRRKRMTTIHQLKRPLDGASRVAFVKGAPNEVVRLSDNYRTDGKVMRKAFLWYGMLGALFSFAAFMFCQVMNGWHPGTEMFGVGNDLDPIYVRATTMALAAIVFTQIGEVWNCRTETASVFSVGLFSNKQINKGILFEIALIIFITLFPPFQSVFHTSPLVLNDFVFLVLLPPVILLLEEARKAIVRKRNHIDRNGVAIKQAPEKR